jgi:hypothetical protein
MLILNFFGAKVRGTVRGQDEVSSTRLELANIESTYSIIINQTKGHFNCTRMLSQMK